MDGSLSAYFGYNLSSTFCAFNALCMHEKTVIAYHILLKIVITLYVSVG